MESQKCIQGRWRKKRYSFCRFEHVFSCLNIVLPRRCFVLFLSASPWGKYHFIQARLFPFQTQMKQQTFFSAWMASFPHIFSQKKRKIFHCYCFSSDTSFQILGGKRLRQQRVSNRTAARADMRRKRKRSWHIPSQNKQTKQTKKTPPNRLPSRIRPEDLWYFWAYGRISMQAA